MLSEISQLEKTNIASLYFYEVFVVFKVFKPIETKCRTERYCLMCIVFWLLHQMKTVTEMYRGDG
jgi:hypothetical protein